MNATFLFTRLVAGLLLVLALQAQAQFKGSQCKSDAQCDDGNMCNGVEYCQRGTCTRDSKKSPCGEGERCDVKTQSCEVRFCEQDFMCNDGNWCNGQEVCAPSRGKGTFSDQYASGRWGCFAGTPPCPEGKCDESARSCTVPTTGRTGGCNVPDADGDGHAARECGGDDCDDTDPNINPGMSEICDAAGVDEDCNPMTFGSRDDDGDGQIENRCCNGERCGTDCNDRDATVGLRGTEVCNNKDDDCNGAVDDGVLLEVYLDRDKDGFGDPASRQLQCPLGSNLKNFSLNDFDCNDNDRAVNPARGNCP